MEALFVGASAGGVTAIQKLFECLTFDLPVPVVIVQHLPADARVIPSLIFGRSIKGIFEDVIDKTMLKKEHIYFAPSGYHLLVEKDRSLSLSQDEMVNFSRPSIDVTFESAALAFGKEVCGVLLTGANSDGARGLKTIGQFGGYTIVQDPKDAEVPAMPRAALDLFKPNFVGNLQEISKVISHLLRREMS